MQSTTSALGAPWHFRGFPSAPPFPLHLSPQDQEGVGTRDKLTSSHTLLPPRDGPQALWRALTEPRACPDLPQGPPLPGEPWAFLQVCVPES